MSNENEVVAPDKLKLAREAGEAIRRDITGVIEHRFEETMDESGMDEVKTLIASLAQTYLSQIIPDVEVKVLPQIDGDKLTLKAMFTGILTITVSLDDEDTPAETTT